MANDSEALQGIKDVKKKLGFTDDDLARMFGYKNRDSYFNSSARPRIETGIVNLYTAIQAKLKEKLNL